jgi:hypothetical protein
MSRTVIARVLLLLVVTALSAACEKTAQVTLNLIEPCDQEGRALQNVKTLQVSYAPLDTTTGAPGDGGDRVTFSVANPQKLTLPLDEPVFLTVNAFSGDIDQDQNAIAGNPQAIGRTVPLSLDSEPQIDVNVTAGLFDSFGQITSVDEDGNTACTKLDTGASVLGRHGHTATYLPSVGKVLILGGAVWVDGGGAPLTTRQCRDFVVGGVTTRRCFSLLKSAELYDPWTGTLEKLPDLPNARAHHTATVLPDGRVLVVGGFTLIAEALEPLINGFLFDGGELNLADLESSTPYGSPIVFTSQRAMQSATLLPTFERAGTTIQQVAIIGGCNGTGCTPWGVSDSGSGDPTTRLTSLIEILEVAFDGRSPSVIPVVLADDDKLALSRALHGATLLTDQNLVVVTGGVNTSGPRANVEVLRAEGGSLVRDTTLTQEVATLPFAPVGHVQVTLNRSAVALIGGTSDAPGGTIVQSAVGTSTVQIWTTRDGVLSANSAELLSWRIGADARTLPNGDILVIGGQIPEGGAAVERLERQTDVTADVPRFIARALALPLAEARTAMGVADIPNGQVVVTGGYAPVSGTTSDRADIYFGR